MAKVSCGYCQSGDDGKYDMIEFIDPNNGLHSAMMSFCDGEINVMIYTPGMEVLGRLTSAIRFCPMCGRKFAEAILK